MFGVVRTVEYNEATNQSLLHFECIHLDPTMRNEVLSFVYFYPTAIVGPSIEYKDFINFIKETDCYSNLGKNLPNLSNKNIIQNDDNLKNKSKSDITKKIQKSNTMVIIFLQLNYKNITRQ